MAAPEKTAPVSKNETVGASKAVEAEMKDTLSRAKVISRLKAIVCELEGGSLVVWGVPVAELAESVEFELEYCEKEGGHELEIELKW